jgi:Flp pilus assembly pilin Flp
VKAKHDFVTDQSGQAIAEYGLLVSFLAVGTLALAAGFSQTIAGPASRLAVLTSSSAASVASAPSAGLGVLRSIDHPSEGSLSERKVWSTEK